MNEAMDYYQAITIIEAQNTLVKMNVSDYPKMSDDSRKSFHRTIFELAYPEKKSENIVTTEGLARLFNGR